jgi:hypothetical protein
MPFFSIAGIIMKKIAEIKRIIVRIVGRMIRLENGFHSRNVL